MERPPASANPGTPIQSIPQPTLAVGGQSTIGLIWQMGSFIALTLLAHGVGIALALPVAIALASKGAGEIATIALCGFGVLLVSRFLARRIEGLSLQAIGIGFDRPWLRHLAVGCLLGGGLITLAWFVYGWCGWRTVDTPARGSSRWLFLCIGMVFCAATAVQEELVCRGYGFQVLYRRSPASALCLGGLVFAGMHYLNTGGTSPIALANLFLLHIFFAACYLRTRSLWLPIGLHTGWNFVEAFVLGMPMSGRKPTKLLFTTTLDTNLWTGREFGPEGGLIVTAILLTATLVSWLWVRQRNPAVDLLAVRTDRPHVQSASSLVPALVVPTTPTHRVLATDVLRGIAVLGILPMNMQIFALFPATVFYPYAGDYTDHVNITVWTLVRVFFGSKDLLIFSMLFGAGILLVSESSRVPAESGSALHYRRMAVLAVFGLFHAYVIWAGDILVTYALCGSLVYLLRNLRPSILALLGIIACAVPLALLGSAQFVIPHLPSSFQDSLLSLFQPSAEAIAHFNEVYGGSWLTQMQQRIPDAFANETTNVLLCMGWIAGGMMLLGMAMQKHGVFTARGSSRGYTLMIILALLAGFPLLIYSFVWNSTRQWRLADGFFPGWFFREISYFIIAAGLIGGVMLICRYGKLPRATAALGHVGRMALTNYLMQSVICSLIFYGHGLGLVGKVDHLGQVLITLLIWGGQLVLSPVWLRRFRYGPGEWLWRSLAYGRWQPMSQARSQS